MEIFFIQFEKDDDNIPSMINFIKSKGNVHQVLGTLYCLVTDRHLTTVALRDSILQCSEDSRIIVFAIPGELNSAWHLTVENSNWLKSILNGK